MKVVSLTEHWKDNLSSMLDPGIQFVAVSRDDRTALERELADADVLVTVEFDRELGRWCRRLRLIVCPAAGTEHIDRSVVPPEVKLVHGSGHEIPMAEYVIGAIVALREHFFDADRALRQGQWKYGWLGSAGPHEELYGSALGLVGYGLIGQAIASRASAFGMRCAAVTMHPQLHAEPTQLEVLGSLSVGADIDRLVSWADAVGQSCELSGITRGLIDARRLSLMKPSALLVNVARGEVAKEKDLYEALASGRIAGAAIDTWYSYPPENSRPSRYPFSELNNVIMTPHSSAWSHQARKRRAQAMARVINDLAKSGERA